MTSVIRRDLLAISNLVQHHSRVLELGCNEGDLLEHLQNTKDVDGRGIEISHAGVSSCLAKGLSVVQGNVEQDLGHYPDKCFDYVISSQVLQATHNPKDVLADMLRIGKRVIVSIPNFGHWKNRLFLALRGRMPVTSALAYQWYETPNIHFCTVKDFEVLVAELGGHITDRLYLDEDGSELNSFMARSCNIFASKAVYTIALS